MKYTSIRGEEFDGEEIFDDYSPTGWDRDPFETEEDYRERIQDQEDYLDSFND